MVTLLCLHASIYKRASSLYFWLSWSCHCCRVYQGEWKDDKMHGCGVKKTIQDSGEVETEAGHFRHDKFLGPSGHCDAVTAEQCSQAAQKAAVQSRGLLVGLPAFTAFHNMAQRSTAWHSTARHGTARHGTARHGTARHSTAQQGIACHIMACMTLTDHDLAVTTHQGVA